MVIGRFPNAPDGSDAVHHTILFWIFKPQYHWTQAPIWLPKVTLRISRARAIILEHKNTMFKDIFTLKSRRARRLGYLDKCPNPEQLNQIVYESTMFLPLRMPGWPKTAWYLCDIYSSSVFDGVLDLFGTPRGDNCFFSQWMHCLSSSRDPTSILSKWEKCIIDHMRPALFLVHFWSNFTVLGKKRP